MSEQKCAGSSVGGHKTYIGKKKKISNYNKKQMLNVLKKTNCHPKELDTMITRFRVADENLIKSKEFEWILFCFRAM